MKSALHGAVWKRLRQILSVNGMLVIADSFFYFLCALF